MRIEIDKQKFKAFLDQFNGDVPYQVDLVKTLLSQMPYQVSEGLIEELYYEKIYTGKVYRIQHQIFTGEIHYFQTLENLKYFLRSRGSDEMMIASLSDGYIERQAKEGRTICGYHMSLEVIKHANE